MPRTARPAIREKDITGLKYFDPLAPLLERLHDDACGRDTAGNRTLHFDGCIPRFAIGLRFAMELYWWILLHFGEVGEVGLWMIASTQEAYSFGWHLEWKACR